MHRTYYDPANSISTMNGMIVLINDQQILLSISMHLCTVWLMITCPSC